MLCNQIGIQCRSQITYVHPARGAWCKTCSDFAHNFLLKLFYSKIRPERIAFRSAAVLPGYHYILSFEICTEKKQSFRQHSPGLP